MSKIWLFDYLQTSGTSAVWWAISFSVVCAAFLSQFLRFLYDWKYLSSTTPNTATPLTEVTMPSQQQNLEEERKKIKEEQQKWEEEWQKQLLELQKKLQEQQEKWDQQQCQQEHQKRLKQQKEGEQ